MAISGVMDIAVVHMQYQLQVLVNHLLNATVLIPVIKPKKLNILMKLPMVTIKLNVTDYLVVQGLRILFTMQKEKLTVLVNNHAVLAHYKQYLFLKNTV